MKKVNVVLEPINPMEFSRIQAGNLLYYENPSGRGFYLLVHRSEKPEGAAGENGKHWVIYGSRYTKTLTYFANTKNPKPKVYCLEKECLHLVTSLPEENRRRMNVSLSLEDFLPKGTVWTNCLA